MASWKRYVDSKSGRPYYYNPATKETTWEVPEEMKKIGQEKELAIKQFLKGTKWRLAQRDGKPYYYDIETKRTQWEMPDVLVEFVKKLDEEESSGTKRKLGEVSEQGGQEKIARVNDEIGEGDADFGDDDDDEEGDDVGAAASAANEDGGEGADVESSRKQEQLEELEVEDDFDELQGGQHSRNTDGDGGQQLQQAMEVSEGADVQSGEDDKEGETKEVTNNLERVDALMNSDIQDSARRYFQLTQDGAGIVQKLSDGYVGYASMSRILAEWLLFAKALKNPSSSASSSSSSDGSGEPSGNGDVGDDIIKAKFAEILAGMISQRFDKRRADQLLLQSAKPAWLDGLLDSPRYRTMLIEMYNAHSDSTLMGVCLRDISARGHHGEISSTIRESDFFEIFQDILKEITGRVLRVGEDDEGHDDGSELADVGPELKRSCCSAEYSFLYATTLMQQLETKLQSVASSSAGAKRKVIPVILRLQRLREELEAAAAWPQQGYAGLSFNAEDVSTRTLVSGSGGGGGFHGLDASAMFSLRLSGAFALPAELPSDTPGEMGGLSPLVRLKGTLLELLDMLKNSKATASNVERLCVFFYTPTPASSSSSSSSSSNDSGAPNGSAEHLQDLGTSVHGLSLEVHPVEQEHHQRCGALLRHPQVLRILIDTALGRPSSSPLNRAQQHTLNDAARLLALAQPFHAELHSGQEEVSTRAQSAGTRITTLVALLRDVMSKALLGSISYEQLDQVIALIQAKPAGKGESEGEGETPSIFMAKMVLQWISIALADLQTLKKGSSSFLKLLPAFFQLLLTVSEVHPSLHPDAFYLTALVLNTSSDDLEPESMDGETSATGGVKLSQENMMASGGYNGIMAHEDAARVIVRLMGWGYALQPMHYLVKKVASFDAALVRHLVTLLAEAVAVPDQGSATLSKPFAVALVDFFSVDRVQSALDSSYLDGGVTRAAKSLILSAEKVATGAVASKEETGDMDVDELF